MTLKLIGVFVIGLVAGIPFIFYNLEQIDVLIGWLLRIFSWVHQKVKLKAVNTQIQAKINLAVENMESEVEGVLPNPIKIEWVKGSEETAIIRNGEVIVKLFNDFDDAHNMVAATMLYLDAGFLRQSRPHTNQNIQKALDLVMAWKLLDTDEETNIGNYFFNQIYDPLIKEDKNIEEYSVKLREIDSGGTLTRIYLRELRGLGRKVSGNLPVPKTRKETKYFMEFLHTIETSEPGSKYPLNFLGKNIRTGITLVARNETLAMNGLRAHKWWLRKKVGMGIDTIYVRAIGSKNIDLARHVAQWGQDEGLIDIVRRQTYDFPTWSGMSRKAVIITCHSKKTKTDILLSPEEKVQAELVRHIPEIAGGDIEIIDIAREAGHQIKVIVESRLETIKDPVEICKGTNDQNIIKLRKSFQESIWFVPWEKNTEDFLIECLGIPNDKVNSIEVDPKSKKAEIVVTDSITAARAIGAQGSNVKLTTKITGIMINILTIAEKGEQLITKKAPNPEDEIIKEITNQINEISTGLVEIIDLVREPGIQSKIVVKSNQEGLDPIKVCLGKKNYHIDELKHSFEGEIISFIKWVDDDDHLLINCLGISRYKVDQIQINKKLKTAKIIVKNRVTAAKCIGVNGINVKHATQLMGLHHIVVINKEDL